jgi:hypothetical protein
MKKKTERRRIVLAVTETSPLPALWRIAKQHLVDPNDELITYLIHDERWRRAASLPFTREVSRISGRRQDFTEGRAAEIDAVATARLTKQLRRLTEDAPRRIVLEVLPEGEIHRVLEKLSAVKDVIIVSSELKQRPVYDALVQVRCRALFVEPDD